MSARPIEKYGVAADKLAPFSGRSLRAVEAPWLITKNLDRDDRGHRNGCPTISMTKAIREAEQQFRRSLDCARKQDALSWELPTSISLARLHRAQGQMAEARDALAPVNSRFKEGHGSALGLTAKMG
jgi:hypothetical protein